jgi:hypothetical protein
MQDHSSRLAHHDVAGGEQACAPLAVFAGGNGELLVEWYLRQEVLSARKVVRTCEYDSLATVRRRRRQRGAHELRRLSKGVAWGGIEGSARRCRGSVSKCRDQPLDPLGLRLAIVVGEADVASAGGADAAIARRRRTGRRLPEQTCSGVVRDDGFDGGEILGAVVHDDDLGRAGGGLALERA